MLDILIVNSVGYFSVYEWADAHLRLRLEDSREGEKRPKIMPN